MGIQVLAGHVVVNHIFFQGGESESVDWERRERTRALGAEAAARLPAGLRQPAAPSRRPAALRLGPASSPGPAPGEPLPAALLSEDRLPLLLPALRPKAPSWRARQTPTCLPATHRPAHLADAAAARGTCREHEADPAPVPWGPGDIFRGPEALTGLTQKELPPTQRWPGKAALLSEDREWGEGRWIWRVG